MRPIQIITPSFADAVTDSVAENQTSVGAGDLTLVSPTVTLDPPCQVTLTAAGDESAVSFIITGTGPSGQTQSETISGPNAGSVTSLLTYATITSINADAGTTIEAGNAQSGYSAWMPLDIYVPNQVTTISASVSGTIDYSVEYTNEDPFDNSFVHQAVAHPDAVFTTCAVDHTASTTVLMRAVRYVVNSGDGTLRFTVTQQSTA
jgi:hypothetical protein